MPKDKKPRRNDIWLQSVAIQASPDLFWNTGNRAPIPDTMIVLGRLAVSSITRLMKIPSKINGVSVVFATAVVNDVAKGVVDAMKHSVRPDIASGFLLETIYVSSARRKSSGASNHNVGRAVDISRINGVKMAVGYGKDGLVTAIVRSIQTEFESFSKRRENFGPALKMKLGKPFNVPGHGDHIHLSVEN